MTLPVCLYVGTKVVRFGDATKKAVLLKADITEVLSDLEDFREQQVLYARYVAGMEWNSIATECGCARATAIRHHHSGLSHIAEIMKNHPEKMILG